MIMYWACLWGLDKSVWLYLYNIDAYLVHATEIVFGMQLAGHVLGMQVKWWTGLQPLTRQVKTRFIQFMSLPTTWSVICKEVEFVKLVSF